MTTVVNLYGGPGTGKSTSAAYLVYLMKANGLNVELVREYVKDWAWEGRKFNAYDQLYFMGKQLRKESMLYGKVDAIVTDSPVMLGVYYAKRFSPPSVAEGVRAATLAYYRQAAEDGHNHVHIFLRRTKVYNPLGRYQTEQEATDIDVDLLDFMPELGVHPYFSHTDERSLRQVLERVGLLSTEELGPQALVR